MQLCFKIMKIELMADYPLLSLGWILIMLELQEIKLSLISVHVSEKKNLKSKLL